MRSFLFFVQAGVGLALTTTPSLAGPGPVIVESGWSLESDFGFSSPMSALINPNDGFIYLAIRSGDLYRADSLGNTEVLLQTDDVAGIVHDPGTGALFFSEDFPGNIMRVDLNPDGTATETTWINGFHSGDDDPVGITPVPMDYTGTLLTPGMMVSTDRGFNGTRDVWTWSPTTAQNEVQVAVDNIALIDTVDIAVKGSVIAMADRGGGIKILNDDASISGFPTTGAIFNDAQGIVFDTRSMDMLVIDADLDAAYRVSPAGEATLMFSGLGISTTNWGGINITDDGITQRIVISSIDNNRVYVFSITPPCSDADLAGPFGQLNFFDVSAFLSAYNAMEPEADFNGDGVFNFFDVSAFLTAYNAGC